MCLTIQCENVKTLTHPVERKNVSCTACTCSFKCQTDIEATQNAHKKQLLLKIINIKTSTISSTHKVFKLYQIYSNVQTKIYSF